MTGMILDGVLMLLLVAALGYGVRLEKKLSALRAGQQAFATAVTELNAAAGRAEAALASLRASGQETDLLHDRIIKAREVKAQLEGLIARAPDTPRPAPPFPSWPRPRTSAPCAWPRWLSASRAWPPPAPHAQRPRFRVATMSPPSWARSRPAGTLTRLRSKASTRPDVRSTKTSSPPDPLSQARRPDVGRP